MGTQNLSGSSSWRIHAVWWPLWFAFHAFVLVQMGNAVVNSVADSLISNTLLMFVSLALGHAFRYYSPGKAYYANMITWSIILAGLTMGLMRLLFELFFPEDISYLININNTGFLRFGVNFLIIGAFMLINWVGNYLNAKNELDLRRSEMEKMAKDAELAMIRQQLQPHFLFNSLNSIKALTKSRPDEAKLMVQQLSDFLRGTLRKDEQKMVSLKEEINQLKLYLEIEKVRFSNRLQVVFECDDQNSNSLIPPMILQPVVENAVKFGLYDLTGDVTIGVRCIKEANYLTVVVINPFDPETRKISEGTGFGLSSVKRRLNLLFSRNDLLHTEINNNYFTVSLKIPQSHD